MVVPICEVSSRGHAVSDRWRRATCLRERAARSQSHRPRLPEPLEARRMRSQVLLHSRLGGSAIELTVYAAGDLDLRTTREHLGPCRVGRCRQWDARKATNLKDASLAAHRLQHAARRKRLEQVDVRP